MTLRWRIFLAIAAVVTLAVGGAASLHYRDVSSYLRDDLQGKATGISKSIQTELEQTEQALRTELARLTGPGGTVTQQLPNLSAAPAESYRWAESQMAGGYLEVLKVIHSKGHIISSGHWPASFGAIDPLAGRYGIDEGTPAATSTGIFLEATPKGSQAALELWARVKAGAGESVTVVVGRFLHEEVLARMMARSNADLLAICPSKASSGLTDCIVSAKAGTVGEGGFEPVAAAAERGLHLRQSSLLTAVPGAATLWVGIDRSRLDKLAQDQLLRALLVSALGLLLALVLGFVLANRIGLPIGRLVGATEQLAGGDLSVRVDSSQKTIGEVSQLVQAFNVMAAELEQYQARLVHAERVATWREIARGLAHELKNPLTPILAALQVVQRARERNHPEFDVILREQADAVEEEVHRLKAMADNFSRFATLPEPEPAPLDLCQLIDGVVALYTSGYDEIHVATSYDSELSEVVADRDRLRTIVSNLVKNAVESMGESGTLTVSVEKGFDDQDNPVAILRIEDTGPGIDPEIRDRLFIPYVTTKGSAGTGLGLALVHRILTEMGGRIDVIDGASGGARFAVRIPL